MRRLTDAEWFVVHLQVPAGVRSHARLFTGCRWLRLGRGLTLGHYIFLRDKEPDLPIVAHEAKHVALFQRYGFLVYAGMWLGAGIGLALSDLIHGRLVGFWRMFGRRNPMERECYEVEDRARELLEKDG